LTEKYKYSKMIEMQKVKY